MAQPLIAAPLVLVVEDDADARDMYEVLLTGSGFRVAVASTGVEGIDKARQLRPQLILMDLSLPAIDGWQASVRLKSDAATRDLPIVALTGDPLDDPERRKVFVATLLKPCLPDELVAEVRRHVGSVHP